jgi:hypothetical protein
VRYRGYRITEWSVSTESVPPAGRVSVPMGSGYSSDRGVACLSPPPTRVSGRDPVATWSAQSAGGEFTSRILVPYTPMCLGSIYSNRRKASIVAELMPASPVSSLREQLLSTIIQTPLQPMKRNQQME